MTLDEWFNSLPCESLGKSHFDKLLAILSERDRGEWNQAIEAAAAMLGNSGFYYTGTCATKLVPSATGEPATHLCAAEVRKLRRVASSNP